MKKDLFKIIGTFLVLFALASVLAYSLSFQEAYENFIAGLEDRIQERDFFAAVFFILLQTLAVMLSHVSSVPFIVIATDIWGSAITLLYVMIGSLMGATIAYFVGSQAIYRLIKRFVPSDKIDHYTQVFNEHSSFLLVELFFLAMPVEIPGYVLGMAKYSYWKFILAATIAYLPFNILIIYAGEAFVERNLLVLGGFILLFIALFAMALYTLYRHIEK